MNALVESEFITRLFLVDGLMHFEAHRHWAIERKGAKGEKLEPRSSKADLYKVPPLKKGGLKSSRLENTFQEEPKKYSK